MIIEKDLVVMQFKMIIADDEMSIRSGLQEYIHMNFKDISVVGVYTNGQQVLEHIVQDYVDIIVTDICMPLKDGLDIAEFVAQNTLNTQVIIISGYRDFEYAKRAISVNVTNYICKPISFPELRAAIKNAQTRLREIQKTQNNEELIRKCFLLRKHLLTLTHENILSQELITILNDVCDFDAANNCCACVKFSADPIQSENLNNTDFICDKDYCLILVDVRDGTYTYFVFFNTVDKNKAKEYLGEIFDKHFNFKNKHTSFFNMYSDITVFHYEVLYLKLFTQYMSSLYEGDGNAKNALLDKIAANFKKQVWLNWLRYIRENIDGVLDTFLSEDRLADCNEYSAIQRRKFLDKINDTIILSLGRSTQIISSVKQYLDTHYGTEVSLASVADKFNIKTSHLSQIFKKETGLLFKEYLLNLRIGRAKELLCKGMTVEDVAARVGYYDTRSFRKNFKEATGMLPTEYINMN